MSLLDGKAEGIASLTLTTLSQPAETITGITGLGEKRTHETLTECQTTFLENR
jgi:hypothetical protein